MGVIQLFYDLKQRGTIMFQLREYEDSMRDLIGTAAIKMYHRLGFHEIQPYHEAPRADIFMKKVFNNVVTGE